VSNEVEAAYDQLKKTARVRGFRRGKAPKKVLAQIYGPAIRADVAQRLVDSHLQKALTDKSVQPLTQPSVEPAELKPKEPFSFKARFEVRPEIEKVEWQGLEAARKPIAVGDDLVEADVEKLRVEHATEQPVEGRPAREGDLVTLKLTFTIDGEEKTEELDTEIGKKQILGFLEEALVGMEAGATKEVVGKFPDNHPMASIKGKDATFVIELVELKERVLPEVDDDFAKDCDHDDLAALKKSLREKIEAKLKQEADEDVARQLVAKLCEKNPIPVPPSLVQQQARMTQRELQMLAQMTGQRLDDPAMQDRLRIDAETKVRAGLLMAEIAKEKEVKVTDDDLEKGYHELAEQTGKNVARLKAEYRDRQKREMLIGMILEDKILDLMESSAKISEAS
jgi:trigger factor